MRKNKKEKTQSKLKQVGSKQDYTEKLNEYIDKYGDELDIDFIINMIGYELSDTIFQQHIHSCQNVNLVVILLQFIFVIIGLIISIFNTRIPLTISAITSTLLLVVVLNNYIHNKTWKIAKRRNDSIMRLIRQLVENVYAETNKVDKVKDETKCGDVDNEGKTII